jgi:predicted transcriptional regulator
MKQKDIAVALDSTEAAVSQYLSGKRAADFKIPKEMQPMFDVVGSEVSKGKNQKILMYGICQICKEIRSKGEACEACKSELGVKADCDVCLK